MALLMAMTMCLLVYTALAYRIRTALKEHGATFHPAPLAWHRACNVHHKHCNNNVEHCNNNVAPLAAFGEGRGVSHRGGPLYISLGQGAIPKSLTLSDMGIKTRTSFLTGADKEKIYDNPRSLK